MSKKKPKQVKQVRNFYLIVVVVLVGSVVAAALLNRHERLDGRALERLAECLSQQGVKMYGTTWCGHCRSQKKMFGAAFEKIDYVECSVPGNPRAQAEECEKAGISSYPTWHFGLGNRLTGEVSLEKLAAKTGCAWGDVEQPGEKLESVRSDSPPTTEEPLEDKAVVTDDY